MAKNLLVFGVVFEIEMTHARYRRLTVISVKRRFLLSSPKFQQYAICESRPLTMIGCSKLGMAAGLASFMTKLERKKDKHLHVNSSFLIETRAHR